MLAWCFKAGVKKSMGDLNVGLFEINNKTNKKQLEGQNSGGKEWEGGRKKERRKKADIVLYLGLSSLGKKENSIP